MFKTINTNIQQIDVRKIEITTFINENKQLSKKLKCEVRKRNLIIKGVADKED